MNSKTNKIIIIVIAAAVLGLSYYSWQNHKNTEVSQTVNEPSKTYNWKTYTNDEYKFQLEYPNNYSVSPINFILLRGQTVLLNLKDASNSSTIRIFIEDSFNLNDLKKFAPTGFEDFTPEQITIGNNIFYYYGAGGGGVEYPDQYFFNLSGKLLVFVFDGPYENDKTPSNAAKQMENKIFSTFKLNNLIETANWKTYSNKEFGFEIKYPANTEPPVVFVDDPSMVYYDPVAESTFTLHLYHDTTKFHAKAINGEDGGTPEDLRYSRANQRWIIKSNSTHPTCPIEQYTSNQNIPYYKITTGAHAGAYVDAFINDKGLVVVAGGTYFLNDSFYNDKIYFYNPQTVLKAICLVI